MVTMTGITEEVTRTGQLVTAAPQLVIVTSIVRKVVEVRYTVVVDVLLTGEDITRVELDEAGTAALFELTGTGEVV